MNYHLKIISLAALSGFISVLLMIFYIDAFHAFVFAKNGCYEINSVPITIKRPGNYCLMKNLTSEKTAIKIKANDVSINLNFNILSGPSNDPSTKSCGIKSKNHKNISIYNGTIQGFMIGVFIYSDYADSVNIKSKTNYGHRVQNVTFQNNFTRGIHLNSRDSLIIGNTVKNTGGSTAVPNAFAIGIESYGVNNRISFNEVLETHPADKGEGVGISLSGYANGSIVTYNLVKNSMEKAKKYGIWIGANPIIPSRVSLVGNMVEGFEYGVLASSPVQHIFLQDNMLLHNHIPFFASGDSLRFLN